MNSSLIILPPISCIGPVGEIVYRIFLRSLCLSTTLVEFLCIGARPIFSEWVKFFKRTTTIVTRRLARLARALRLSSQPASQASRLLVCVRQLDLGVRSA